jgi:ferredoxin
MCKHLTKIVNLDSQSRVRPSTEIFGITDMFKKGDKVVASADTCTIEFLPSKVVTNAAIGASLSDVAAAAKVEIQYKCKKGECGTCEVQINGKWVKACQTTITSADPMQITIRPAMKKKPAFFSPQSLADGFNNNVLGMVGLVTEGIKVEDEYQARMIREKKLADLVAAKKAEKK